MRRTRCGTMIPTNGTGPPSETAAPVESDALTSATRSARTVSTPRVAAWSAPRLIRSRIRGSGAERDRKRRAERGAGRDAERVGRRERIPEQRLEHHSGRRKTAADQGGRDHARQARDEEDLRVDVVGEWRRSVEDLREIDRRTS